MPSTKRDSPVPGGAILDAKYIVGGVIARLRCGVVTSGVHLDRREPVALTFLDRDAMETDASFERILAEVDVVSRLRNRHFARPLDVGRGWDALPYLVTERVRGRSLARIGAGDRARTLDGAIDCVLDACEAVGEAHREGIVHRDLSPRTLVLTPGDDAGEIIKVVGLGLPTAAREGDDIAELLVPNGTVASASYMAPERLLSAHLARPASDVFSLGAVLYNLLTGIDPFVGRDAFTVCRRVASCDPIPIERLRPEVGPSVAAVVSRALGKSPLGRPRDADELASELVRARVLDDRGGVRRLDRSTRRDENLVGD